MCVCVCVNESVYVCACVGEKVQLQRMGNGTILCIINQRVYVLQTAEPMLDYILWSSPTSSDLCDRDVKLSSMDLGTSTAIEACTWWNVFIPHFKALCRNIIYQHATDEPIHWHVWHYGLNFWGIPLSWNGTGSHFLLVLGMGDVAGVTYTISLQKDWFHVQIFTHAISVYLRSGLG